MVRRVATTLNGAVPENLPVITRPRSGAMIGGVCAGLARRWQVDPALLRIAAVVLVFFGGLGLVAYGTALLLLPREGAVEQPVRRLLPFTRRWSPGAVAAVTITIAGALAAVIGSQGIGLGPVLLIAGIWFFGFRGRGASAGRAPLAPPAEPTPYERAAEHWRQRLVEQQAPGFTGVPLATATGQRWVQPYTDPASDLAVRDDDLPVPVGIPAAQRRNWGLWWLALALVGTGVLAVTLLGAAGLPATPLAYLAAVLAGLGATLLVAARSRRPPLLLPATLATAAATAVLLLGAGMPAPRVGEVNRAFASEHDVPAAVHLSAGEVNLDLSRLQLTADRSLDVRVGAGTVSIVLPDDVATEVTWVVKAGAVDAGDGSTRDGFDMSGTTGTAATDPASPTLRLTVTVDFGELEVIR